LIAQLSTVHYFLAIFFGSLCVLAFGTSVPRYLGTSDAVPPPDRARGTEVPRFRGTCSAFFYFAALLAKEIAAPLPLLLLFLPGARKWRGIVPHAVELVAYLIWRRAVIGAVVGAYSWATGVSEWPRILLSLPWNLARAFAGVQLYVGLAMVALMLVVIAMKRRAWLPFAIAMLVAILPILPVAKSIHRRYAVMPWLALSVAFAASTRRRELLLGACALAVVINRQEWSHEYRERMQMSDEGRFFMQMPECGSAGYRTQTRRRKPSHAPRARLASRRPERRLASPHSRRHVLCVVKYLP
jgi:hypothetical protein